MAAVATGGAMSPTGTGGGAIDPNSTLMEDPDVWRP